MFKYKNLNQKYLGIRYYYFKSFRHYTVKKCNVRVAIAFVDVWSFNHIIITYERGLYMFQSV